MSQKSYIYDDKYSSANTGRNVSSGTRGNLGNEGFAAKELVSLNSAMRDMLRKQQPQKAVEIFSKNLPTLSDIATSNPMMVADAYDFALQAFALQGDARQAERLVSSMWKQKIPVGRVANSSVVKAMCAAKRYGDALKYLKSISSQRSDIVGYNILMSACASEKDYFHRDIGMRAWNLLKKKLSKGSPMKLDAITWSASIRVHGINRSLCDAVWTDWLSHSEGLSESDRTSVGASYVAALCSCGAYEKALEQCQNLLTQIECDLPEMLEIPPMSSQEKISFSQPGKKGNRHSSSLENVRVACNTLLHASVASSNDLLMGTVLKLMTSRGLAPDTSTYNALLRRSLRRREGSLAIKEGLAEMRRMGIPPDQTSIEILINSHACQGQIIDAEKAVDVIIRDYGASPCHAWGTLMAACGNAGDVENVAHVFRSSIEYVDQHIKGQTDLFEPLIDHCLHAICEALGKEYWRRILHRDTLPMADDMDHQQQFSQDHIMQPENHIQYIEDITMSLLEEIESFMRQKSIPDTERFWMYKLKCFGSLGKAADVDLCLQDMGINITKITDEDAMLRLIFEGPNHSVRQQNSSIARSHEDYSNLLQIMARLGRLDACFGIVELIKQSNARLSPKDYISLIEGCAQSSPPKEELSRALLKHARESGIPIDTRFFNALILVRSHFVFESF